MSGQKTTIIALGGSLMVPKLSEEGGINVPFLRDFRELILQEINSQAGKGRRFVIVAGGGKVARAYQKAASEIVEMNDDALDWIGIYSTRINARLLVTIFEKEAYEMIIDHDMRVNGFKRPLNDDEVDKRVQPAVRSYDRWTKNQADLLERLKDLQKRRANESA